MLMKTRRFIIRCLGFLDSLPKRLLPRKITLYLFQYDLLQRHQVVANIIRNSGSNTLSVLDVGGSSEGIAIYLSLTSYSVVSVDIDYDQCKNAKQKGIMVVQGDASHLPFKSNAFNIVPHSKISFRRNVKVEIDLLPLLVNAYCQLVLWIDIYSFPQVVR